MTDGDDVRRFVWDGDRTAQQAPQRRGRPASCCWHACPGRGRDARRGGDRGGPRAGPRRSRHPRRASGSTSSARRAPEPAPPPSSHVPRARTSTAATRAGRRPTPRPSTAAGIPLAVDARPGARRDGRRRPTGSRSPRRSPRSTPTTRSCGPPGERGHRRSRPGSRSIADAAVDRTLIAVAGTHGKSTTAGWLVHVLVEAGRDPAAFVGALLGPDDHRRRAGDRPVGARGARSWSRPTSTPATSTRTAPTSRSLTTAEWDHPDVFADEAAVLAAFDGMAAVACRTAARSSPTSATPASPRCSRAA